MDYTNLVIYVVFLVAHVVTILGVRSMVKSVASDMKDVALEREETLRQKQMLDEHDPLRDDGAVTWTYGD